MTEGHRDVLRREFERIAKLTDEAYMELTKGPPRKAADYRDWASLLLRYHAAIEQVAGKEPAVPPRSMKGAPDAIPSPSDLSPPDDSRPHPDVATEEREPETEGHRGDPGAE